MLHPLAARVTGRVAADGQDVTHARVGVAADDPAQLADGVVDRGQVSDRRERGFGGDPLGLRRGVLACRTAGTVSDRDEVGTDPLDTAQRLPQLTLLLRV